MNNLSEHLLKIGEHPVRLLDYGNSLSPIIFFNLHQNEATSIEAAKHLVASNRGRLLHFDTGASREIEFDYLEQSYRFDPNRVFSEAGIVATLGKNNDSFPDEVVPLLMGFATQIIDLLKASSPTLIAAVHNTGDDYCIESYVDGGSDDAFAEVVHVAEHRHRHEFFYVLSREHFDALVAARFNAVLQKSPAPSDDGSLSVYCAEQSLGYVNIEGQFDGLLGQVEMLNALWDIETQRLWPR